MKPLALAIDGTLRRALAYAESGRVVRLFAEKHPLYVRRDVLNAAEIVAWAKAAGFKTALNPEDMHVTVAYSRDAVDWGAMGDSFDRLRSSSVEGRSVEFLGDKGGIVLKFRLPELSARWQELRDRGCSWEYEGYTPHVTLTYENPDGIDPEAITPYAGAIELGPEKFEALDLDWADKVAEHAQRDLKPRLDALEAASLDALRDALGESRDALVTKVRKASDFAALANDLKRLPRFGAVEMEVRAMLDRAREAGMKDLRREVREGRRDFAGSSFKPKAALRWLRATAFWVADILGDRVLADVKGIILNGLKTGTASSVMAEQIFDAFLPWLGDPNVIRDEQQLQPWRLETIVRTNTTTAYNHGRLSEIIDPEIARFVKGIRYSAILDERTTEVCRYLGKMNDGKGALFKPTDPNIESLLPPNHYNAVVVGTPIKTHRGDIPIECVDVGDFVLTHRGRWRRVYAVMSKHNEAYRELHLSTGRILRVTDEHPILMSSGWLRADGLKTGDILFQHGEQVPGSLGMGVRTPDYFPSLFDEDAVSYERVRFASSGSFPAIDLQSNAERGPRKVNHVAPDGVLEGEGIAVLDQKNSERRFMFCRFVSPSIGSTARHLFHAAVRRIARAAHAFARLLGPLVTVFTLSPRPMAFTGTLGHNFREPVRNSYLRDTRTDRDAKAPTRRSEGSLAEIHGSFKRTDGFSAVPMFLLDQLRHAISIGKVHAGSSWVGAAIIAAIEVRRNVEVWNLAVEEDETYHAEGIVVHNCRSIIVAVVAGEKVDASEFITPEEIGKARGLADPKFLAQQDAWRAYREPEEPEPIVREVPNLAAEQRAAAAETLARASEESRKAAVEAAAASRLLTREADEKRAAAERTLEAQGVAHAEALRALAARPVEVTLKAPEQAAGELEIENVATGARFRVRRIPGG